MVNRIVLTIMILILVAMTVAIARAGQVTLGWDPIPGAEGYHIYQRLEGQAYDFKKPAWTGAGGTCTIDGLIQGRVYHFVARAFAKDRQSGNSNEVTYRVPGRAPGKTTGVSLSND
jgi:hypothetical protein